MEADVSTWFAHAQTKVGSFFGELPTYAADILIFGPLGIFVGFLSKTLGRYFFIGLVLAIGILWLGHYLHIVSFNHAQIQAFLGGHPVASLHDVGALAVAFMSEHIAAVFAAFIGFILGWKLGS